MKAEYQDWIDEHYPTRESAYGKCDEATTAMRGAFPELTRVRGHYYCTGWGERAHWWLVTETGERVDPTAKQFPSGGVGVYERWTEGAEEPTGKCPNCDGPVYGGGTCCSDACADAYGRYIMFGT